MRYLVTQFSQGLDSCASVTSLALAVNDEMEKRGKSRYRILVPLLYGEQQLRLFQSTFATNEKQHPGEIVLDDRLGRIIAPFLNNEAGFAVTTTLWIAGWQDVGRAVRDHYKGEVPVMTLSGEMENLHKPHIALEISRTPRFHFGLALAYQVTSMRLTQLFQMMTMVPSTLFSIGRDLMESALKVASEIERNISRTFISVPGPFTPISTAINKPLDKEWVPPVVSTQTEPIVSPPPQSIYITIPSIGLLKTNLSSVLSCGHPVLTNDPIRLGGGTLAPLSCINHPHVLLHITPAHWDNIALSMLHEKPILFLDYDSSESPEFHFNSLSAREWGWARMWNPEIGKDNFKNLEGMRSALKISRKALKQRFGSADGTTIAARAIVDDLLGQPRPAYE